PSKLVFITGPQNLTAGTPSQAITVQLQDTYGNVAKAQSGGVTLNLQSDSTAGVFLDTTGQPLAGSQVTIAAGDSAASVKPAATRAGTPRLTASAGFSMSQQESVAAAPAVALALAVPTQGIAGGSLPIGVDAVDPFGNIDTTYTGSAALALTNAAGTGKPL